MDNLQKKVGDVIEVLLDNRAGAGLTMKYKTSNDILVSIEGPEYLRQDDMRPGDKAKVRFKIHILHPGNIHILFFETRVWEQDFQPLPAKELSLTVTE